MSARTELKDYWQRVVVVTGPGYAQLPPALQKVMAGKSLTYCATEFAINGGNTAVDENGRPARMETARVFAELSKTIISMPLLEEAELTINDVALREHSEYMRLVQPVDDNGIKASPSPAIMHLVETTMRMRGNSIVTRMEDGAVKKSRTSYVNVMKVPKKLQEYQIHHDDRIPLHTVMPEVRPFDQTQVASAAFQGAPTGIRILQLTLQKRFYTKVGTSLGAAAPDREISGLTISALIRSQELKAFTDPKALIRLFGNGWTTEFLTKVMKLTAQQALDLLRMAQILTMGQMFALYTALGQEVFNQGPITLLQRCWKCQSLGQTLTIIVLTWGQTRELLSLVKWIHQTVLGPKDTTKKKNAKNFWLKCWTCT